MNNETAGLLLIGFSLLTAVIAFSFGRLIDAVKASSAHISGVISGDGGSSLAWGGYPPISYTSTVLILITIGIGLYLLKIK